MEALREGQIAFIARYLPGTYSRSFRKMHAVAALFAVCTIVLFVAESLLLHG